MNWKNLPLPHQKIKISKQDLTRFSDNVLDMTQKIFKEIKHESDKECLLLFIGASAAYMFYAFRHLYPKKKAVLLPISGMCQEDPLAYHSLQTLEERLNPFCMYFNRFYRINPDIKSVYVIDFSSTGYSIQRLVFLIRKCFQQKQIHPPKIHFIKLSDFDLIQSDFRIKLNGLQQPYPIPHTCIYPKQKNFMNDIASHYSIPRAAKYTPLRSIKEQQQIQQFAQPDLLKQFLQYLKSHKPQSPK